MCLVTGVVKIIVFVFNFIFSIVGIILISVGSWAYVSINKNSDTFDGNYNYATGFVIGIGVLVFLISFLGCCGVCQGSKCMLKTYAVILIILFILQIIAGVLGYVLVKDEKELQNTLEKEMYKEFDKHTKETYAAFYKLQDSLKCCGVKGYQDYVSAGKPVPANCCKGDSQGRTCTNLNNAYAGCGKEIFDLISSLNKIVAYVALGIAAVELAGAIFGFLLACTM